MEFVRVALEVPHGRAAALEMFYTTTLGFPRTRVGSVRVGVTELSFREADGRPFYHFAILTPGDRFDAAREWIGSRVAILGGGDIEGVVFDFDNWNALALYFHDPAGNIVELIAHRGFEENGRTGHFHPSEFLSLSEIGLVGEQDELAQGLEQLGVRLWDGVVARGRLAFFGSRGRAFILASEGRSWLPTGQPAEVHPVQATITGTTQARGAVGAHLIDVVPPPRG